MQSSSRIYLQEIIDHLNCVVIKFEPFEDIFNKKLEYMLIDGFDEYDKRTYPYYRILAGDAAFSTEPIYGFSPALKGDVLLTRENIIINPDIEVFYRDTTNLKALLDRYPNDHFIIRRILNPVTDIDAAINSKNLTILPTKYTDTFINQYENSSLMIFLQDMLWLIDYRWYMSPLEYEDLYPHTFWSMLWSILPVILLTKRILNIKTVNVHPFHIWEYLTSLGFGKYRGYLTRGQELFLYRNALYLKFHAGKKFLLAILEKEFLNPLRYSLSENNIYAHTLDREQHHDKIPDVIPSSGNVPEFLSSSSFESLLKDIFNADRDDRIDEDYIRNVTDSFKKSSSNKLQTKFLSLDRNIDISEMMLLIRFILDSTVFLDSHNKLQFPVSIQSPMSNLTIRFDNVTDALNLFYYCIYVRSGLPVETFKKYTLTTAVPHLTKPDIPLTVKVRDRDYLIASYVDVASIVDEIPYISDELYVNRELSNQLGLIYVWLFAMINKLRYISEEIEYETHHKVFRTLVPEAKTITVKQTYTTYEAYFNHYPEILTEVQKINDPEVYGELMFAIINGICPLESGFAALARDDEIISVLINKIKELFTYMVSYNITFLNKVFEQSMNADLPKIVAHIVPGENNVNSPNLIIASLFDFFRETNNYDYTVKVTPVSENDINIDYSSELAVEATAVSTKIDIGQSIEQTGFDATSHTNIFITSKGVTVDFLTTF